MSRFAAGITLVLLVYGLSHGLFLLFRPKQTDAPKVTKPVKAFESNLPSDIIQNAWQDYHLANPSEWYEEHESEICRILHDERTKDAKLDSACRSIE